MSARLDPKLRAHFKEIARLIISRDRSARKHGISQNTIGEITTAIALAYEMGRNGQGYADLPGATHAAGIVDWATIPPQARRTLEAMTWGLSKRLGYGDVRLWDIERLSDDPRPRWGLTRDGKTDRERTIAHGGVAALIRMELLEPSPGSETVFRLTELGTATCHDYWRRSDADDSTLPKISLR